MLKFVTPETTMLVISDHWKKKSILLEETVKTVKLVLYQLVDQFTATVQALRFDHFTPRKVAGD